MNLAGISIALALLTLAFVTMPWGIGILVLMAWVYSRG